MREFHTDIDLKRELRLAGQAGTAGQILQSGGSSASPLWVDKRKDISGIAFASPTATEKILLRYTEQAEVISRIFSIVQGTTPSVTFQIRYGSDISQAGTLVISAGTTVTNTTTGLSQTSFDNASVPAGNLIWLTTSAVSGTVTSFTCQVTF